MNNIIEKIKYYKKVKEELKDLTFDERLALSKDNIFYDKTGFDKFSGFSYSTGDDVINGFNKNLFLFGIRLEGVFLSQEFSKTGEFVKMGIELNIYDSYTRQCEITIPIYGESKVLSNNGKYDPRKNEAAITNAIKTALRLAFIVAPNDNNEKTVNEKDYIDNKTKNKEEPPKKKYKESVKITPETKKTQPTIITQPKKIEPEQPKTEKEKTFAIQLNQLIKEISKKFVLDVLKFSFNTSKTSDLTEKNKIIYLNMVEALNLHKQKASFFQYFALQFFKTTDLSKVDQDDLCIFYDACESFIPILITAEVYKSIEDQLKLAFQKTDLNFYKKYCEGGK